MADYELTIQVHVETELALPLDRLRAALTWVLRAHATPAGTGVSLVIVDDAESQRLNREFRGGDRPTDVLSFAADPAPVPDPEPYLGDLVLALPYIRRQASTEGHTLADELVLATVHGTLHLLGYDHDTPEHQATMWARQAEALQALGIEITVPLFDFPDEETAGE